ncbi:histidine phosphatase family protein [Natrarchaeobius sp. A-rgal3]|uniref:histidine phosphatase family protein n=1 Tax=Natrarchaeobius versutus TaxID=1679078 RepID=UPI00351025AD
MTDVLLVRHGETQYNLDGVLQGRLNIPLNETGIAQARALADELRGIDVRAIYSSPLQRSHRTAEIISTPHELAVTTVPTLKERSYGELEGCSRKKREEMLTAREVTKSEFKPTGGEDCYDVVERTLPTLEELARSHSGERILVVAHGSVNRSLLSQFIAGTPRFGYKLTQSNTGVNRLEFDGSWCVRSLNDTAHLRKTPENHV